MSTRVEENERVKAVYEDTGPKHDGSGVHVMDDLRILPCLGDECQVLGGRVLIVPKHETRRPWPDFITVRCPDSSESHTFVSWSDGAWACSCGDFSGRLSSDGPVL